MTTEMTIGDEGGLKLQNLSEMMQFAEMAAKSSMVPSDFRGKPENCVIALQMGMEVGLSPMTSLQNIAVINGRPSIYGDVPLAICRNSPHFDHSEFKEEFTGEPGSDQRAAVCTCARLGSPAMVSTFSVADAKRAGLWGKQGPWAQYPQRMLMYRARSFALRDCFGDLLKGLKIKEEYVDVSESSADVPSTPTISRTDQLVASMGVETAPPQVAKAEPEKVEDRIEYTVPEGHPLSGKSPGDEAAKTDKAPEADSADICSDETYGTLAKIWMSKVKADTKNVLKGKYGFKMITEARKWPAAKALSLLAEVMPVQEPVV